MRKKIQIICTKPGMRRHGIEHPASATYEPGHWTAEQLHAFLDDPSFHVQEIDENAVVTKGDEFDKAVAEAVGVKLAELTDRLQASFNTAVKDGISERTAEVQGEVSRLMVERSDLVNELNAARAKIAELEAAAPKKTTK